MWHVITKCVRYYKVWQIVIAKCVMYYKVWQTLLQKVSGITKSDSYYKVRHSSDPCCSFLYYFNRKFVDWVLNIILYTTGCLPVWHSIHCRRKLTVVTFSWSIAFFNYSISISDNCLFLRILWTWYAGVAPLSQTIPMHSISCTFFFYTLVCFPLSLLGHKSMQLFSLIHPSLSSSNLVTPCPCCSPVGHLLGTGLLLLAPFM